MIHMTVEEIREHILAKRKSCKENPMNHCPTCGFDQDEKDHYQRVAQLELNRRLRAVKAARSWKADAKLWHQNALNVAKWGQGDGLAKGHLYARNEFLKAYVLNAARAGCTGDTATLAMFAWERIYKIIEKEDDERKQDITYVPVPPPQPAPIFNKVTLDRNVLGEYVLNFFNTQDSSKHHSVIFSRIAMESDGGIQGMIDAMKKKEWWTVGISEQVHNLLRRLI